MPGSGSDRRGASFSNGGNEGVRFLPPEVREQPHWMRRI
jgi:hypothetical protein